jgi:acyl-CoA dehydrogenase
MVSSIPTYGLLAELPAGPVVAVLLAALLAAGYLGVPVAVLWAGAAAGLWLFGAPWWTWVALAPVALLCVVPALRRRMVSDHVLAFLKAKNLLPSISDTERIAIEAGDVWVDGELFSGKPDLRHLATTLYPELTAAEQAFLDGPTERACAMTDDWQVHLRRDLPPEIWQFVGEQKFFGMIIPTEYGGLGFSAAANSAVVQKLASRSLTLAITVMVPNSLGPAELLIHYGTDAQRRHWLPRLARGEEIPCFALTEPGAGSDAASMEARGVVFRGAGGQLSLRLNWRKRYITLAAVSTVLGLAFKLEDPDELLGRGKDLGITCALVPTNTPGVVLGRRHDPLGVPFYNCPTEGHDVIVPIDAIIGGQNGAGHGWRMLMECLAAGRGISLPATSTGGAKLVARAVGAYASVRKQFGLPIGKFEGVEEPLARIAGFTYLLDAARRYTVGGIDAGAKPPVVTAIVKYTTTELYRTLINDGMDVMGGAGISRGPNNVLAHAYAGTPISITVEGANILTRTLMVFGQGAIRCHPWAIHEIESLAKGDRAAFDRAFWGHVGHVVRNGFRSVLLSVTRGRLARAPVSGPTAPYWRRLAWASASFALFADLAMAGLGGDLKRKEKITGRFADVFAWMFLATATLRRFAAEGQRSDDLPLVRFACEHAFARIQEAFDGILANLRVPGSLLLRGPIRLWSRLNPIGTLPNDRIGALAARAILEPGSVRDRLTAGIHVPPDDAPGLGRLELAMRLSAAAEPLQKKLKDAVRAGTLPKAPPAQLLEKAAAAGVLAEDEVAVVRRAEQARAHAIQVDSFGLEEYLDPRPSAAFSNDA